MFLIILIHALIFFGDVNFFHELLSHDLQKHNTNHVTSVLLKTHLSICLVWEPCDLLQESVGHTACGKSSRFLRPDTEAVIWDSWHSSDHVGEGEGATNNHE